MNPELVLSLAALGLAGATFFSARRTRKIADQVFVDTRWHISCQEVDIQSLRDGQRALARDLGQTQQRLNDHQEVIERRRARTRAAGQARHPDPKNVHIRPQEVQA